MSSTLAAALLRHQRSFFCGGLTAGFLYSFATGQSALDALHATRGASAPPARLRLARRRRVGVHGARSGAAYG